MIRLCMFPHCFNVYFYLAMAEDVTTDVMKLALNSIISKYIQEMHSNSTVIHLPDKHLCL